MKTTDFKDVRTLQVAQPNGLDDVDEVIFPALEVSNDTTPHQVASLPSFSKSPMRRWLAVASMLVVALVIAIYLYQQRGPIRVPAATSVVHAGHTSTPAGPSTNAIPQAAGISRGCHRR